MAVSPDPDGAARALAATIERHGPVSYEELVDHALYHPLHGFFSRGGAAGRRHGDFITSPEVGPLFGTVMARVLDECWETLGEPDPFVVVECGAGTGTLARTILAASPACLPALTYALVERSAALRARHREHLPLEAPQMARTVGNGPHVASLEERPALSITGVVLANELLDNLPFRVVERAGRSWREIRIGIDATTGGFAEVAIPAPDHVADDANRFAADAPDGARVPLQLRATAWLRDALGHVERGRVIVIDYMSTTSELATRPMSTWVRTYREHGAGGAPLESLGYQDITVDVCMDQLARVREPDRSRSQAEFLRAHGLQELVDEGKRIWHERAHIGDLEAIRGRSRVREAEALTDPTGLGGFHVLEWDVA